MPVNIKIDNIGHNGYPNLKIDDKDIPITGFNLSWDIHQAAPILTASMIIKTCDIDLINGHIKINGFPISDSIGKRIFKILQDKYGVDKFDLEIFED